MKRIGLFIFAVMFLANTVVVSAWAKPCSMNNPAQISQNINASMSGDMPCHDKQEKQNNGCCEDICLCVHVSVSQTTIMNSGESLNMPSISSDPFDANNEIMASRTASPPYRPPISHS